MPSVLYIRFHLIVALSILFACVVQQPAYALSLQATDGLAAPRSLGGSLAILADPTGTLTVDDVAGGRPDLQFKPIPAMLTEGYRKGALWVRFSLSAPPGQGQWLLQIERPLLESVTLYVPDGAGHFVSSAPGRIHPSERKGADAYPTIFPIEVPPAAADYYVRLQSSTSMTTSLNIWQAEGYAEHRRLDDWIMAMVVGSIFVMILTNLLYAIWLKDSLYAIYVPLLVTSCLISVFHMGYASEILQFWDAETIHLSWGIIVCLYSITMMLFLDRLFEFRSNWIWAARFSQLVIALNVVALGFSIAGRYGDVASYVSRLQQFSLIFIALFVLYLLIVRRKDRYILSFVAFLSVIAVLLVMQTMYTGANPLLLDGSLSRFLAGGTVIHLILLSAAVAKRTQLAERSLSEEKDRTIALSRSAEQELTLKVSERTAALAASNASLQEEVERRQLLEVKLQQSLDAVNDALAQQRNFVALVSHEFRAPLAVIAAAADNLSLAATERGDHVGQRAAKIRQTVKRMSMLIENVLTGERLDAGYAPLTTVETFDLNEVLATVEAGLDGEAAARLRFAYGEPASVKGDRNLLEIVVLNLIQNGLKYSTAPGLVTVRLSGEQGKALVTVTDEGSGIAPGDREFIFMKYYRAAGQRASGSGLGLYVSREIARQHGGDLSLEASDASGSTFRLWLPIGEQQAPETQPGGDQALGSS